MAYWGGEYCNQQYQTLSLTGNVLSLEPLGSSVTLPSALAAESQLLIDALNAKVAAMDAYIRAIDSAIEIVGITYNPPA